MSELFAMGVDGPYVWSAYGITLAVVIWNVWSARARLKRNLRAAESVSATDEPTRRAKVSQL